MDIRPSPSPHVGSDEKRSASACVERAVCPYRARVDAEVLSLLDRLRARGMNIPTGEYMSHFEPGRIGLACVCAGADFPREHVNRSGAMLGVRKLYTTRHG